MVPICRIRRLAALYSSEGVLPCDHGYEGSSVMKGEAMK